ncbi:saxiphilin-like isoform X1 [Tachysurus fulvidraco]|uniref:saxiphilin-like isoform X1 n=1 Tax=Tachysurus fulvidraco TaxID=1234273 RepID=UPI000F5088EC|nr:saxiphilin-like isoform X1 [Tachysurus fulvidraco]
MMKGACGIIVILLFSAAVRAKKMRWCVVSEPEQRKCADLAKALGAAFSPAATLYSQLSCVRAFSTADCLSKIRDNKADLVTLDAGEVYSAVKQFGLAAVAKEIYSDGTCLLAVAVVRNTSSIDIHSLKGAKSCHSGARWTSGWNLPLGQLLSHNLLPWAEGQPLSQAVSAFFNTSCVPGAGTMPFSNLCSRCQGQKSYVPQKNFYCETSHSEPFYHNQGALRCLKYGAGDVAFVDHTALESIDDSVKDEYRLLCTDGTQAPLSSFRKCNFGRGPGGAVVTRINNQNLARKFLSAIQTAFGRKGKENHRFQLFDSSVYRVGDLLFRDVTDKLFILQQGIDISQVLGLDYVALLKGLRHEGSSLEDSVVRWCCISHAEQEKCEQWALSIKSDPLVCVSASSMSDCIEKIKRDKVDAVSLDATHAFIAGKCGFVPVVTEYYGMKCDFNGGGPFEAKDLLPVYGVAVARRSSRSLYVGNLAGRRSCHGPVYSPAGWVLPVQHSLSSEHNDSNAPCEPNKVYSKVFWKGCMPGAEGSLCKVCVGGTEEAATKRCSNNHNERYYGNMGALRCLVGDQTGKSYGDVAFMEHHNLDSNIKYLNSSGWAKDWDVRDFELLCADGQRASLTEWKNCNLGAIPPNIVMTRPVLAARIYDFLMKSQKTRPDSEFRLFESQQYGESDLLFKDATRCLVHTNHMDYRTILGEDFFSQVESIFNCTYSDILQFCNQDVCSMF